MKAVPAILVSSAIVVLFACSKDKFETKPRLEIKDYNTRDISSGGELVIRLNYFDKEGDLGQAAFTAIRVRTNALSLPPTQEKADTFRYPLPEFPDKDNGEITFRMPYDFLRESISPLINDSMIFRFAVVDRAGNASDTLDSEPIIVRAQ
ncbi:hypothetical protein LZZ85_21675 [Terrimonas sp. NA20]|uniref:Uncharacterized protein n=1 Tax=Terrimonas ginsenosidimutans TaxID=2908004 RepID=A0ABS9KXF6_9BACT|nr:hypothetical protein [Terrimonas ginsenosidimutans]MCG2616922.1 hypothetical protein [Terrimonas ginsenosidimutans]